MPLALAHAGRKPRLVGSTFAKTRVKAEEPQDAQIVFGDAFCRATDEADSVSQDIGVSTCKVCNFSGGITVKRIHREVAAQRIGLPIIRILNFGAAAVGLDVMAKCRDFERLMIDDDGDRAMVNAGGHHLEARRLASRCHFLRRQIAGEIDFGDRYLHQRIAHRTSRHPRLATTGGNGGEQRPQLRVMQEFGAGKRRKFCHVAPYTRAYKFLIIPAVAPQM